MATAGGAQRYVLGAHARANIPSSSILARCAPVETFQKEDGSRVTSRWVLTGANNGYLGTEPDQKPIAMTGTAVWAVGDDGKLLRNWVERASFEQYRRLSRTVRRELIDLLIELAGAMS